MAAYDPIYRAYVFTSDGVARNADGTLNLAGSTFLTPIVSADHSDAFKVSSAVSTGFKEYLDLPRGRRGQVDYLTKRTDIGRLSISILDKKVSTDNFQRWVTAFLGDDEGRAQLMGKPVYVEESTDGGTGYSPFFFGRISRIKVTQRLWITLDLYDLNAETAVKTFRGRPTATYANPTSMCPVGLIFDYGPHALTPMIPATRNNPGIGLGLTDIITVDEDEIAAVAANRNLNIITSVITGKDRIDASEYWDPGVTKLEGASLYIKLVGGSRDGETGYCNIVPFTSGSGAFSPWIQRYFTTTERDNHLYLQSVGISTFGSSLGASSTWDTTDLEIAIVSVSDPTEERPFLIDDVHPVQLWADILDGKFGPFTSSGAVRQTTPRDTTAFTALIADTTFPDFRGMVTEPAYADEWIEDYILAPYNLAYYRDGEGRVVPVDLRERITAGIPTLVTADTVTDIPAGVSQDLSKALTDIVITYYVETPIAREDFTNVQDKVPDVPAFGLVREEAIFRLVDIGNPDVPPRPPLEIDALGFSVGPEEQAEGVAKAVYYRGIFDKLATELQDPFGSGMGVIELVCRRTTNVNSCTPGLLRIIDVDEVPDAGTNRRGGPRLGRCLARIEDGPVIRLQFLDLGKDLTAGNPTLGTISQVSGESETSAQIAVTALNSDDDPVVGYVAITDTGVGTRPAEDSSLWFYGGHVEATGNIVIRGLPGGSRVWGRARSQPRSSTTGGLRLPSPWVFPSNDYVDLVAYTAPSGLTVSEQGGVYVRVTFTPGESELPTEVWLDGVRLFRLPAGSTEAFVEGLAINTTYNSPGLQLRHINPLTGGVSPYATITFTTNATYDYAPDFDAAILLVGESG